MSSQEGKEAEEKEEGDRRGQPGMQAGAEVLSLGEREVLS
jgi:hypothetical protein